jgi:hypothetical protein
MESQKWMVGRGVTELPSKVVGWLQAWGKPDQSTTGIGLSQNKLHEDGSEYVGMYT